MLKITIVIPTYDKRIDSHTLLPNLLKSVKALKEKNLRVIILNNTIDRKYHKKIQIKIENIIKPFRKYFKIDQFGYDDLDNLYQYFNSHGHRNFKKYLHFKNYSGFRNIGLLVAYIINTSIVIFIDDDEVIEDKTYLKKAQKFIGKKYKNKFIGGITGYYINPNGSYTLPEIRTSKHWWGLFWNKNKYMNKTFEIIGNKNRLNETTFALGGNLILHRNMFKLVPFDPFIQRGEDMDLLINAKSLGFALLLDNKLGIRHYPPSKDKSDIWTEIRRDTYRFIYTKKKLSQLIKDKKVGSNMVRSLDPYPGYFLRKSIYLRLIFTSFFLGLNSIFKLKFKDSVENFKNIKIALIDANKYANENCRNYFQFQEEWSKLTSSIVKDDKLVKYFNNKFK